MAIQLECPGCKSVLQVDDALAGKQGKCIHCGHRVIVPGTAAAGKANEPVETALYEATPEAMVRELGTRGQSAVLFLFRPPDDESYDLTVVADGDLKCIVTEDITGARFAQWITSVTKRFAPRKKVQPSPESSAISSTAAVAVAISTPATSELLYELKGDRLGMSLEEFKRRYARGEEGTRSRLPLLSDEAWGSDRASLHSETWHRQAGIVHARTDLPSEDNSPTVAGVKTDLLLYQFVDGQLFRISAFFPTDLFHLVSGAAVGKYGPVTAETQKPRILVWENPVASVCLTRGSVHPPEPSQLVVEHKSLTALAASRAPSRAGDI